MAGINFLGSYSGVDQAQIDALMQAEKLPLVQLANKKTSITDKQNAWKDINTRLNSLSDKLKTLQSSETFTSKLAKSTNEGIVSMTASKNAVAGTYKINVQQLATSTSFISGKIDAAHVDGKVDINKNLGISGSFVIKNADYIQGSEQNKATITIEEGNSLKDIVNQINDKTKDTGISATIIDGKIVMSDKNTGDRNISLDSEENNVLTNLGLNVASRTEQQGKNAKFTINGVTVERNTNNVKDVVEYVTINLTKAHTSTTEYDTVTVSQDTEKLTKAIQDFVDQYNSTMTFLEDKMAAGDPEIAGSRGTLAADSSLQRLHSSLRGMITSTVTNGSDDIKDISQLGVTTIDKFGKLQFDVSKLTESLAKDPQNVMNFFTSKNDKGEEIGYVPRLKDYVDSFISKSDGVIKGKTESFERTLKDLNKQIDRFSERMVRKEAYYTKMFAALDVAMMNAESQMSWLNGQVSAMNAQKK